MPCIRPCFSGAFSRAPSNNLSSPQRFELKIRTKGGKIKKSRMRLARGEFHLGQKWTLSGVDCKQREHRPNPRFSPPPLVSTLLEAWQARAQWVETA